MNIEDNTFQFLDNTPKIRVCIRKRPLTKKELQRNDADIIDIRGPQTVVVRETKTKVDLTKFIEEHNFNFDHAYDETSTNQQVYEEVVRPLVDALFNRAKCTCFAYGQTGSGKTFTMMGDSANQNREYGNNSIPGLYLLATQDIFELLKQPAFQHLSVHISFYEIYCGKLHDLLNDRQQLFAREDAKQNVNIVGLAEKRVINVHSVMQIIDFGNSVRTTSSTSANVDSSRSHAILQISLKDGNKLHGKMSFIDLAGSERGADVTDSNKQTRMDGAEINKSLLALKECIRALDQDKKHTPFRGSKLTLVLKDSFTGNCKTVMFGNISPSSAACEHTLNTLRYADRVKELKKPQDNSQPLSQMDLLAKQLMLPRQNKNSTKFTINTENQDEAQSPSNGNYNSNNNNQGFNMNINQNNNFNDVRDSKARFSMPVGNSYQPQFQQQQQQFQFNNQFNQFSMMNNNNNNMNNQQMQQNFSQKQNFFQGYNANQYQAPENLFETESPSHIMRENQSRLNTSSQASNKSQKQSSPIYQPNLYKNNSNNISYTQQQQQPMFQRNTSNKENFQDEGNTFNPMVHLMNNQNKPKIMSEPLIKPSNTATTFDQTKEYIQNFRARNEEDLQIINQKHEELINIILAEEEEVICTHRQHIDDTVDLIKQEMALLNEVDKPASDIDEYVENLDTILVHKIELINMLRNKLVTFRTHLKEEENLSKLFYEQRNEVMDIFDLGGNQNVKGDEFHLLDDLQQVMN